MIGLDSGSATFIFYGLGAALIANLSVRPGWRFAVLIGASLVFVLLLASSSFALLPLAGFLAAGYAGIVAVRRGAPRVTTIAVIVLIGLYAWLKQYSLLPRGAFLAFPYLTLGLSYIFFRVLHLVIDAGEMGAPSEIGPAHYLAYTLNFTTFVSGPIQLYPDFRAQIDRPTLRPDLDKIGGAVTRVVIGFFKVNVLALLINMLHVDALAELGRGGDPAAQIWAASRAVFVYPFFLYCNFSGYIDIVIGIARLLGLDLPENFNRPFSATSFIDFWNRWHITLSAWLKTYVYNPLLIALIRRFPSPSFEQPFGILAFFVTFFLVGVWHGRTSEFLFFGLLQGSGMAINKIWQVALTRRLGRKGYRALAQKPAYAAVSRGLTFLWFSVSLIWFWADWSTIAAAAAAQGATLIIATLVALWLCATVFLGAYEALRSRLLAVPAIVGWGNIVVRTIFVTTLALVAFVMTAVLSQGAPGIVYRAF